MIRSFRWLAAAAVVCMGLLFSVQGAGAKEKVILDTDMVEAFDDGVAMVMLANAPNVELLEGSIISIDVTLALNCWQSDSCFTAPVGKISAEKQKLIDVTQECFWLGARMALNGNRIGDVSHAVQQHAEKHGYGVVRDLTGHGIGKDMHEDPSVPNFGEAGHGVRIRPGMTFCIEPMITMGHWQVHQLSDGWTIVTNDHSPAAHYEHTIAVTPRGLPEILTLPGFKWGEAEA